MSHPMFTRSVGVAPGTTTMQFAGPTARVWYPYGGAGMVDLRGRLGTPRKANIRWDIIGVIGGGALVVSLLTGLIASSFK